jgi:hypothetical protein
MSKLSHEVICDVNGWPLLQEPKAMLAALIV